MDEQKIKICSLVGLVLILVSLIMSIIACIIPEFVVAELQVNEGMNVSAPATDSVKVASLGVFQTEYDPSDLTDDEFSESGLPREPLDSPTTEFPLLFPGQENFVASVLPVNRAALANLGAVGEQAEAVIGPSLDALDAVDFDTCDQYFDDVEVALLSVFESTQQLVPLIPSFIFSEFGLQPTFVPGFQRASALLSADAPPLTLIFGGALPQVVAAAAGVAGCDALLLGANTTSVLDVNGYNCMAQIYTVALGTTLQGIFNAWPTTCPGLAIGQCLGLFGGSLLPDALPTDSGADLFVNQDVCALTAICGNKQQFAELLFGVVSAIPGIDADLLQATALLRAVYYEFLNDGLTDTEIADAMLGTLTGDPLPVSFFLPYTSCQVLSALLRTNDPTFTSISDSTDDPARCGLLGFLAGAAGAAAATGNSLEDLLTLVTTLYGGCANAEAEGGALLQPNQCPQTWGPVFFAGAYSSGFDNQVIITNSTLDPSIVFDKLLFKCEDDETDIEKIGDAQTMVALGTAGFALAFVVAVVSLIVKHSAGMVMILAGLLSLGSGSFLLGALLLVQSAPIYDNVGLDEATPTGDIEYESGVVPLLALVAFVLGIVSTICLVVAGVSDLKLENASDDEPKEAIEVKQEEKAAVNPVAEESKDETPAPAKEDAVVADVKESV